MKKDIYTKNDRFENFSAIVTKGAGSTAAFGIACAIVILWGASGPLFNYSENWQFVISSITTVITFLMVFIIQKAQNKDSLAIHLKLNELVASHELSSNELVNIEDLTEEEMRAVEKYYKHLRARAKNDNNSHTSYSLDDRKKNNNPE